MDKNLDFMTADPWMYRLLKDFAKQNRDNPTEAERTMWAVLKSNNLGVRFRRQHIIGMFIADFACIEKGIVIEIDGGYHQLPEQCVSDKERTEWLQSHGFDVLRFTNEDILGDIDNVIEQIEKYIDF